MGIGHFAVGFASKALLPRVSLVPLLIAPVLLDMLWPIFLLLGIERARIVPGITAASPLDLQYFPWSHSLVMTLVWSALAAFAGWVGLRNIRAAGVLALGVFSHWILDVVSHRPDMPLSPGSDIRIGLGLWNSKLATFAVEGAIFAVSVWLYVRATRPKNRVGTVAFVAFIGLLLVIFVGSLTAPPPPDMKPVIITAFVAWLFLLWAWWIERNRMPAAG